jgi:hypothetical protein
LVGAAARDARQHAQETTAERRPRESDGGGLVCGRLEAVGKMPDAVVVLRHAKLDRPFETTERAGATSEVA